MGSEETSLHELTREFFDYYPDYALCRALAFNLKNNVTTYRNAIELLTKKASAAQENREQIEEKLDRRSITVNGNRIRIRELSLRQIMDQQEDRVIRDILDFYFKHPYAHGRTRKSRLLPRWLRTFFLSSLVGHAKRRNIDFDYDSFFEMLRLL